MSDDKPTTEPDVRDAIIARLSVENEGLLRDLRNALDANAKAREELAKVLHGLNRAALLLPWA